MAEIILDLIKLNIFTLFGIAVFPNIQEPDIYLPSVGEISLTFESKEMYEPDFMGDIISGFSSMLKDIHHFITNKWNYQLSDQNTFVRNIIVFEILFSKSTLLPEEYTNPKKTSNLVTFDQFIQEFD